jgi:thiosulfate reductase cytochrome b subunit
MLLVLMVLSGLVLWKSVQFPWLRTLLGGYEGARLVHFLGMCGLVFFFLVHVTMVARVPRTLRTMIVGR